MPKQLRTLIRRNKALLVVFIMVLAIPLTVYVSLKVTQIFTKASIPIQEPKITLVKNSCKNGAPDVSLSWGSHGDNATYELYRNDLPGYNMLLNNLQGIDLRDSLSYEDFINALNDKTTYIYTVYAVDNAKSSLQYETLQVETKDCSKDDAEGSTQDTKGIRAPYLSVIKNVCEETPQVTLSWNSVKDATAYTVMKTIEPDKFAVLKKTEATKFQDTELSEHAVYNYYITAQGENAEESIQSNPITVLTKTCKK